MKFIWAAYKKGSFRGIIPDFDDPDYSPSEFGQIYDAYLDLNMLSSWTVQAKNEGAEKPVGLVIAWQRGPILEISDMVWFDWATQRNIFEGALKFFDQLRRMEHGESGKKYKVLEFARAQDKKYFERMMDLGVLKRCGKLDSFYPDQDGILFYTNEVT